MAMTEGCEAQQEPTLDNLAKAAEELRASAEACHSHLRPLDDRLMQIAKFLGGTFGCLDRVEAPETGARKDHPGVLGRILATHGDVVTSLNRLRDRMSEIGDVVSRIEQLLSVPEQEPQGRSLMEEEKRAADPGIDSSMAQMAQAELRRRDP